MRIAIISDSHGNLTALDAVLADVDQTGPYDEVLMGGDVAYGGPFPLQCIERIQDRGYRTVRGNTDQMIIDAIETGGDEHGAWVVEQLDARSLDFLRSTPVQVTIDLEGGRTLALVHATPWSIYESVIPDSEASTFRAMLAESGTDAVAYGHIHLQHRRDLETGTIVAVGSLGLPFDGDQRAMYTVIETNGETLNVDFRRLEYDVEKAIQEASQQGGPNGSAFAHNLRTAQRPG